MIMIAWIGSAARPARRQGGPAARAAAACSRRAIVPFTLPVVLLGGIWGGIFTPTEAAAVAAFWALVIGAAIYRNLGPKALVRGVRACRRANRQW